MQARQTLIPDQKGIKSYATVMVSTWFVPTIATMSGANVALLSKSSSSKIPAGFRLRSQRLSGCGLNSRKPSGGVLSNSKHYDYIPYVYDPEGVDHLIEKLRQFIKAHFGL
jgi:hypothetical protein